MKLRQWIVPTILLWGVNFDALAETELAIDPQQIDSRNFYIGADLSFYNKTELEVAGISIDGKGDFGDLGYNAAIGYQFNLHDVVKIGVEGEYRSFGKINYYEQLDVKGNGAFLNVKPKFIVLGDYADVYVALLAGIGSMDMDAKLTSEPSSSYSKSEVGYQFGAEVGIIFNPAIDLYLGYRSAHVDIDDINISISSGYAGVRYHF
ncbi:porin family protein [Vibrio metschnikovii]|uniref:outer membrane beta-barrel protein n=1 Tax=Vibrio TaxID=662 RepID=UPI000C1700C6|nr:outer membrane beta-barrel protein [Vibrio fujianensis]EKO3615548.1 porin family protein [Vibrio metschnikovii]EKO3619035.1 porin family protein [Vibrio metschnikovii]EKO3633048.1 porin family protein [Vibrio metschnikovii]EKO3636426.1 porin family protein [Vibrio metschnikovii]EKO3646716.1 porin family protein [Vibrio metschnikovii]